ncbi:MAG TPA: hypothetical protein PKL08_10290 [Thermoanaerobaculaceae bacterium]|nr:hypothetical protein [Thermoanaerobaculaceae bacterium]
MKKVAVVAILSVLLGVPVVLAQEQAWPDGKTSYFNQADVPFVIEGVEYSSQEAFVAGGHKCATRPVDEMEDEAIETQYQQWRTQRPWEFEIAATTMKTLPVWFHVFTSAGKGNVTSTQISNQITILKNANASKGFDFTLAGVEYIENATCYAMS